jgi:hypothetical protein
MTRDDYYNMAVASGLWQSKPIYDSALMAIDLMRFVEMVAAVEREACAKIVEEGIRQEWIVRIIVKAIRARGIDGEI